MLGALLWERAMQLKDNVLDDLAGTGANVAQFVSFDPHGRQRFARVRGIDTSLVFSTPADAIRAIHATQSATSRNVNIRTFLPDKPDGNPFLYGPKHGFSNPEVAAEKLQALLAQGYYAIANETIDEGDGGFSGVLFGDLFEFASRDIPRCVEKPGCAALSRELACMLIRTVYGFDFSVPFSSEYRVECSVHPGCVGYRGERQIVWQAEHHEGVGLPSAPQPSWPNRYSRDMGDKAFGLLIAHLLGFPVPATHVFGTILPYFAFGFGTRKWNGEEVWLRTCPREQQPGRFATRRGWHSPAELRQAEDPSGEHLASTILQEGVKAEYSGAAVTDADGDLIIEGKASYGDTFMVGEHRPELLPAIARDAITSLAHELQEKLGAVRFEWVFDGENPWIVQLHVGASESSGSTIYPGNPETFIRFDVTRGLEELRVLVREFQGSGAGIVLVGEVGITSHFGDLLRRNKTPSRIERS